MRRLLASALAALGMLGGVAVVAAPATGHPSSWYYTQGKWPANSSIRYGVNAGYPGGNFRYRLLNGKDAWNAHDAGYEPSIYWTLSDDLNYGSFSNPCGLATGSTLTGVVFWMDLDYLGSAAAGATLPCESYGLWSKASIAIDSDQNWYTGTGDAPGGTLDLWSVASHEFGHFVAFWGHLAEGEGGVCPMWENSIRNTMCPAVQPGYEVQRGLSTHDIHTHHGAY